LLPLPPRCNMRDIFMISLLGEFSRPCTGKLICEVILSGWTKMPSFCHTSNSERLDRN
jgi:hypothetical protein